MIRWIGLRHPFRACRVATLDRELCNRFYLEMQDDWYSTMIKETVVTKANLRRLSKFTKHRYNSWTNYLRCVKKPACKETSYHWSNVPDTMKTNWATGGANRGNAVNDFEHSQREKVLAYDRKGPLGSTDPMIPIDLDVVSSKLHSDFAVDIPLFYCKGTLFFI